MVSEKRRVWRPGKARRFLGKEGSQSQAWFLGRGGSQGQARATGAGRPQNFGTLRQNTAGTGCVSGTRHYLNGKPEQFWVAMCCMTQPLVSYRDFVTERILPPRGHSHQANSCRLGLLIYCPFPVVAKLFRYSACREQNCSYRSCCWSLSQYRNNVWSLGYQVACFWFHRFLSSCTISLTRLLAPKSPFAIATTFSSR